ncbi:MAG: hypothetical protein MI861_07140 [Pirellulales bacterium]|nr:hypothetical protein [Pirellulales bacterium]
MMRYLNPIEWTRWFAEFLSLWAISIPWLRVSHGLPALILLVALACSGVIAISEGTGWRDRRLIDQRDAAWARDDFDTVELIVRRQLASNPDDNRLVHQLALVFNAQEQFDAAADLMRQLVKIKRHEQSARWLLINEYKDKQWGQLSPQQQEEYGDLITVIYQDSPDEIAVQNLYADYLVMTRRFPQAITLMERLSVKQPLRGFEAAHLARRLGNEAMAERLAKDSLEKLKKTQEDDPNNSRIAALVAQNLLFLKRHLEAINTLQRATKVEPDQQLRAALRQSMGNVMVDWVTFIQESPVDNVEQRLQVLKMLQDALIYAPNNPNVLNLVVDRVLNTVDDENQEVQSLRQALVKGTSPGIAHFIEGTTAMLKDDVEKANRHLKIAAELLPNSNAILNNLAVAISEREDGNLEYALKLINTVLDQSPNIVPHYYETRGQILFRLKRYLKAVPDLERALVHPKLAAQAHQTLAKCYAELGDQELSRQHQAAAERLQKETEMSETGPDTPSGESDPSAQASPATTGDPV